MQLFLTSVLPFLAHDHASAAAFLTCRSHNFHASIIPEFLSDEERVKSFCEARQKNRLEAERLERLEGLKRNEGANLMRLFVQTPHMQFSPSLVLNRADCARVILEPLLRTKYFSRTLQRCTVDCAPEYEIFQALSKVQSLTKLDLGMIAVDVHFLKQIINSFPNLGALVINWLSTVHSTNFLPTPAPAIRTLRNLTLKHLDPLFVTQFVLHFTNLRKLVLSARNEAQELDLLPLSSSLLHLTDLHLEDFTLKNTESLKNLAHLSTLQFSMCIMSDLSFLTQDSLPQLTMLCIDSFDKLSTSSFASLAHVPNVQLLKLNSFNFNNDCFQYLEHMVHLRTLDLSHTNIVGDSRSLKTLMQNLFQLEELHLYECCIGGQGAIAGALYNSHSRLRYLNLTECELIDDDLSGIGALKNTLEVLHLSLNYDLSNKALVHCKDLVKLKVLDLGYAPIDDLSPLKDCSSLEELDVSNCRDFSDDSFKVFSEAPNSFPNLRILNLVGCETMTEKIFEHLPKNNHLVYQLKELDVEGIFTCSVSASSLNNLCQLTGLRRLCGVPFPPCGWDFHGEPYGNSLLRLRNIEVLVE